VILFTLGIPMITGILASALPELRGSKTDLNHALRAQFSFMYLQTQEALRPSDARAGNYPVQPFQISVLNLQLPFRARTSMWLSD
jgi:hypothetical protein